MTLMFSCYPYFCRKGKPGRAIGKDGVGRADTDDVIELRVGFEDIDERTVAIFVKGSEKAGRLPVNEGLALQELFEKLRLTENGRLKRSAIILFGKEPGKYYPNTFVKIGRYTVIIWALLFKFGFMTIK